MFGKMKVFSLLSAVMMTVALSAAVLLFAGCPDEPEPMEPMDPIPEEPVDPEDQEPMELPDM